MGSLHMTIQTAVLIETLAELGADVHLKAERVVLLLAGLSLLCRYGHAIQRGTLGVALVALVVADLAPTHRDLNLVASWEELDKRTPAVDPDALRRRGLRIFHYQTEAVVRESGPPIPVPGLQEWFHKFQSTENLRRVS